MLSAKFQFSVKTLDSLINTNLCNISTPSRISILKGRGIPLEIRTSVGFRINVLKMQRFQRAFLWKEFARRGFSGKKTASGGFGYEKFIGKAFTIFYVRSENADGGFYSG
ncbi:MAG: hypothetical protein IJF98_04635, partial [Firmicutes bacterium]|nr:hypothetical protein [Bacillota bacterium]